MDCYFRQSWVDRRLSFEGYKGALALSIEMLSKIWKPDTYGKYKYPLIGGSSHGVLMVQFKFIMGRNPICIL